MSLKPRLVALALAPGLVVLLLALITVTTYAHSPDGATCGKVYRAAWKPESLVFSGERGGDAATIARQLRAECHADALTEVRKSRNLAFAGTGLLVFAGGWMVAWDRRSRHRQEAMSSAHGTDAA